MLQEISQTQKDEYSKIRLYQHKVPKTSKLTETETRAGQGLGEGKQEGATAQWDRALLWDDEESSGNQADCPTR